jgi:hypothetical protein
MRDLCIRESYKDNNGEEKVSWNKIGIIFTTGEKTYAKLNHIPGVLIHVFEQKKKEQANDVIDEEQF